MKRFAIKPKSENERDEFDNWIVFEETEGRELCEAYSKEFAQQIADALNFNEDSFLQDRD